MNSKRSQASLRQLRKQWTIILAFIVLFWGLEIFDWVTNNSLDAFGIHPRTQAGLWGILFAPFLHFGFEHLLANSIPFAVLGWFVLLRGERQFIIVTFWTIVVGGLGVWIFAESNSNHAGASILIFGYFGYLLFSAIFERSLPALTMTLLTLFLYSSMIWGVLPLIQGVSWQGHLFGFIGGAMASRRLGREARALAQEEEKEDDLGIRIIS